MKNKDKPPAERDRRWWKRWGRKRIERIRRGEIQPGRFVGGEISVGTTLLSRRQ